MADSVAVAASPIRPPGEAGLSEHLPQPEHPDTAAQSPRLPPEQTDRALTLREYSSEVLALTSEQAGALNRVGGGKYLSVEPEELAGYWRVTAHNYVGSVNVAGLQVLVRPKIPLRNLFLLLEVGLRDRDWHDEAVRYETTLDLLPALVSFFARTTETTLARGLFHSYREQRDRLVAMRGRVDIARQLAQSGLVIPMHCKFTDFTADLIENSYLKAAVSRSLRVAGVQPIDRRRCQGPVGSAQWRTVELPVRGQQNCPVVARCSARGSVGQPSGVTPLPAVAWVRRMLSPAVMTTWAWWRSRSTVALAMVLGMSSSNPAG